MPALVVAALTIPVAADGGFRLSFSTTGGVTVAFDNSALSDQANYKRQWEVTTRLLTAAEYAPIVAALQGTPPLTCSGDLLGGSVSCVPTLGTVDIRPMGNSVVRYVLSFTLREA
jgi:hypothetical protein